MVFAVEDGKTDTEITLKSPMVDMIYDGKYINEFWIFLN